MKIKFLSSHMTKALLSLICIVVFSSCSSRMYTVYFDKNPPKKVKHLENISVKEYVNTNSNYVGFNVEMKAFSQRMKYSDQIVKRKVIAGYDGFVDWVGGVIYGAGPIFNVIDFVSFGHAFSVPMQKRYIRWKRGFKKVEDESILKISKAPQFGLGLVSFLPFYTAPFWHTNGLAYPKYKVKDSKVPLNSIPDVKNKEIIENLSKGSVPLKVYCDGEMIKNADCASCYVSIDEYVKRAYQSGRDNIDLRLVVGNSEYQIDGGRVFNFSYSIDKFLPEEGTLKEIITSNVKGATIYAGTDRHNLKIIGKTPYEWESEKNCYPKLEAKYFMIKKPGYIDSKIIYCSSTKDDRVLNVNLEKEHYGYLSLSSSVNSVKIFVDGKFKMTYIKGKSSRLKLKEGNYTVSAKKEGYRDFRTNVFIENKGRTSVRMNLDKIEYGFLKLTSSGSAKIFVDNVFKFEMNGAKAKYIKLAEGSHTVKAIVNGRVEERRVRIGADGNESISF